MEEDIKTIEAEDPKKEHHGDIPTMAGFVLIFIILATAVFLFWEFRSTREAKTPRSANDIAAPQETTRSQSGEAATVPAVTAGNVGAGSAADSSSADTAISEEDSGGSKQNPVDIDLEIKKLDSSMDGAEAEDFSASGLADDAVGL